jgi:outer membrane lipopolysaccharide assembly protein LptE/RlpB
MNKLCASAPLRFVILLGLSMALTACGFQPRGQAPAAAAGLTPIAISGIDSDTPLYLALRRQLGKDLTADAGQAAAVLIISRVESRRELLTVGADNKANEYELIEGFSFQVRQGDKTSSPQRLTTSLTHYAPGSAVLARRREEGELRQAMRERLAEQLLRRLAAWK